MFVNRKRVFISVFSLPISPCRQELFPLCSLSEVNDYYIEQNEHVFDQNLKSQIMTTNLWVEQFWKDYKLQWDPEGIALAGTLYA